MKNKFLKYFIAVVVSLCSVCGVGALGISIFSGEIITLFSTPTIESVLPQQNFSTIIAQTAAAAQTQTIIAMPPPPLDTATFIPSTDSIPTATIFIFKLQTEIVQPTNFIYSTATPFALATQPQATLPPPQSAVCSCSGNTMNCADFNTHAAAQACFNYCNSQGAGDIHRLDNDSDGTACENLP